MERESEGLCVSANAGYTIWFADDNEFVLGALLGMFNVQLRGTQSRTFYSADDLIERLRQKPDLPGLSAAPPRKEPDIIFLDQSMPGTNGIEAIPSILHHAPSAKIIMLTNYAFPRFVELAFQQGAYGYVLKSSDPQQIMDATRAVIRGRKYIDPAIADDVLKLAGFVPGTDGSVLPQHDGLTPSEMEVLHLLGRGLTRKQIAQRLKLSVDAVKIHFDNCYKKLGVHSQAAAVVKLYREHLLQDEDQER
jgi:DNA-binding NarL/FixJ family response regulator